MHTIAVSRTSLHTILAHAFKLIDRKMTKIDVPCDSPLNFACCFVAGLWGIGAFWDAGFVHAELERGAAERRVLWRRARRSGPLVYGGRVRYVFSASVWRSISRGCLREARAATEADLLPLSVGILFLSSPSTARAINPGSCCPSVSPGRWVKKAVLLAKPLWNRNLIKQVWDYGRPGQVVPRLIGLFVKVNLCIDYLLRRATVIGHKNVTLYHKTVIRVHFC